MLALPTVPLWSLLTCLITTPKSNITFSLIYIHPIRPNTDLFQACLYIFAADRCLLVRRLEQQRLEQQERDRQERERQERERQERERLERERQVAAGQETPGLVNITALNYNTVQSW